MAFPFAFTATCRYLILYVFDGELFLTTYVCNSAFGGLSHPWHAKSKHTKVAIPRYAFSNIRASRSISKCGLAPVFAAWDEPCPRLSLSLSRFQAIRLEAIINHLTVAWMRVLLRLTVIWQGICHWMSRRLCHLFHRVRICDDALTGRVMICRCRWSLFCDSYSFPCFCIC